MVNTFAQHHTRVIHGRGDCSFWDSNWTNFGPIIELIDPDLTIIPKDATVAHFIGHQLQYLPSISPFIHTDLLVCVQNARAHNHRDDRLIWKLEGTGTFSFKSTYNALREHQGVSKASKAPIGTGDPI